jgi:hypothetical protein
MANKPIIRLLIGAWLVALIAGLAAVMYVTIYKPSHHQLWRDYIELLGVSAEQAREIRFLHEELSDARMPNATHQNPVK